MIDTLAIIGPGALGLSLARWAAERGLRVALAGRDREHAARKAGAIEQRWDRALDKGRITSFELEAARGRLHIMEGWERACEGATWVLEALPESIQNKASQWAGMDARLPDSIARLTGTSSIPVAAIRNAAGMKAPLTAFHCFLPMERMPIVEIAAEATAPPEATEKALELASRLGKRVVRAKDQAGFAAARMALAQGLEAMRLLESGTANARDLDALMTGGYGHPVGPLELSDRVGLDLRLAIAQQIHETTGDPAFEPPVILLRLVAEGRLGLKTGAGFHEWQEQGRLR